jgi:hypothetical protein
MVIATPERPAVQPFSPPRFSEASGPMLDARIPSGPLTEKWDLRKFENKLVAPANRRKFKIIVVGTGLAGASAAASLGEQGYDVQAFCIHDSPRRAHSIAALLCRNSCRQSVFDVYRNGKGCSKRRVILRNHWRKLKTTRIF